MNNRMLAGWMVVLVAAAQSAVGSMNSVAGQANPLDNAGGSARATGMGSAFVGVADDAAALAWNPAGLADQKNVNLGLNHNGWLAGIVQETLVGTTPVGSLGGVGLFANYVSYGSFEGHDNAGAAQPNYSPNRYGFGVGWGMPLLAGVSAGIVAKESMQTIASSSYSAFSVDLGALWVPMPDLRVGLTYDNLGTRVVGYTLASALSVGASYRIAVIEAHSIIAAASGAIEPHGVNRLQLGAEDVMFSMVAVRLGYQANLVDNKITGLTGLAAGLGLLYHGFSLDYAYLPFGDLGTVNRISLGYSYKAG